MPVTTEQRSRDTHLTEEYTEVAEDPNTGDLVYLPFHVVYEDVFSHLTLVKDSTVSSKQQNRRKVLVKWVPKKFILKAPNRPVLVLKALPVLKERGKFQSDASWRRAVALFHKIRASVLSKNVSRTWDYEARLLKYNKRLVNYLKFVEWEKNGAPGFKAVRSHGSWNEFHPYELSQTYSYPPTGWILRSYQDIVFDSNHDPQHSGTISGRNYSKLTGEFTNLSYDVSAALSTDIDIQLAGIAAAAKSRARKRLNDAFNEVDLHVGNIIAERHQTLTLISSTVKRIAEMLKGKSLHGYILDRKASITNLSDLRKQASDDTLAFFFGVKPLMQDLYSLMEVLAEQLSDQDKQSITVRASARVMSRAAPETGVTLMNSYYPDVLDNGVHKISASLEVRCSWVLEYNIENETQATLASLGLVNPMEIAWEMMPWSFVIDWFLPIGDFIKSLSNQKGLTFKRGTYAEKWTSHLSTETNWFNAPNDTLTGIVNGTVEGGTKTVKKTRVVLDEPPTIFFPQFKSPISRYHIIEALALISQRIR